MIPETLDTWTLEVVRQLVGQGVFETDRFDFVDFRTPRDVLRAVARERLGRESIWFAVCENDRKKTGLR